MARQLDQILVVDVEATCWEKKPPAGQESEIIEVGICVLDVATGERLSKESILVRPERSELSPFCTELTTLTQEQVDTGITFKEACQKLRKGYLSREWTWASFGDYDRRQFERQCRSREIGFPFGPTHLNVKNLFGLQHKLKHEIGMAQVLDKLGLPLEGTLHRGDDDAWNIALILSHLLRG